MIGPVPLLFAVLAMGAGAGAPLPSEERCSDPWIDRAVAEVAGRLPRGAGDGGECDLRLYGARWASYEALRAQVDSAHAALSDAGLEFAADGAALRDRRTGARVRVAYLGRADAAPAGSAGVALPRGFLLVPSRPRTP